MMRSMSIPSQYPKWAWHWSNGAASLKPATARFVRGPQNGGSAERKIREGLRGRTELSATPWDWNRLPMPETSPPCTFLPETPSTYLALSATRGRQTANVRFDTPERLLA